MVKLCWPSEGLFSAGMVGRISGKVSLRKKTNAGTPNCTHFCFPNETDVYEQIFKIRRGIGSLVFVGWDFLPMGN
jgi:hypothetical protein